MNSVQNVIAGLCFFSIVSTGYAVELLDDFPHEIHPEEKYVFYSHGLIVEGTNPRPVHPDLGIYEFPKIAQEIFKDGDFNLVAHHRPANTDPAEYSEKLVLWVNRLLEAGVKPNHITLIGFSRGAQITAYASTKLNETGINTVLMGMCFDGDFPVDPPIKLGGHILSIYETSDEVKSCRVILERSQGADSTREIAISTGLAHGAFFTPMPDWISPVKLWLSGLNRE